MTLEDLIRKFPNEWGLVASEYIIRVQDDDGGRLHVYVRASDRNSETTDFTIKGNELTELFSTENLNKQ